jgi:hypothetical protein
MPLSRNQKKEIVADASAIANNGSALSSTFEFRERMVVIALRCDHDHANLLNIRNTGDYSTAEWSVG